MSAYVQKLQTELNELVEGCTFPQIEEVVSQLNLLEQFEYLELVANELSVGNYTDRKTRMQMKCVLQSLVLQLSTDKSNSLWQSSCELMCELNTSFPMCLENFEKQRTVC